jgi:putative multiple sugar transport system ATP-binding protein
MGSDYLLEMKGITKRFPGVLALDNVDLKVKKGEIHAIVGENGAGKSTLMNILSGVYPHGSYEGTITFQDAVYEVKGIRQSEQKGIAIIHQEFTLTPYLSIAENIFLGNERRKNGVMNWHDTRRDAMELALSVGLVEDVDTPVKDIGVGQKQLVEIIKAISKNIQLLILDEPTAALNEVESKNLLSLLVKLKKTGMTSVLISHKLNEVLAVSDSITIIRDGTTVEVLDVNTDHITENRIVKGMVGRDLTHRFPERQSTIGERCFEVKKWTVHHSSIKDKLVINDLDIHIRRGEVVGLAGLMGAGRTEFAMSLFGKSYGKNISGEVWIDGKPVRVQTVGEAIESGIAYISEDRKGLGLILESSVKDNITLANLDAVSDGIVINANKEIVAAEKAIDDFKIKCPSIHQQTIHLSGGNQQKVVLAKWLYCNSDVYILDEPTRGIDVGAKYDVYTVINRLAKQGKCILLISSELPELIGMCDRIYLMSRGKIAGELEASEASQERIMELLV